MARFPVDQSKLPEIGRALARAVNDPAARQELEQDPKKFLTDAGVDPAAIGNLQFTVVTDSDSNLHIVVPAKIDQSKVNADDDAYLTELGSSVVLSCHV